MLLGVVLCGLLGSGGSHFLLLLLGLLWSLLLLHLLLLLLHLLLTCGRGTKAKYQSRYDDGRRIRQP